MRSTALLLAALASAVLALAQPRLTVTSPAVVEVRELAEGGNRTYIITVELPPLTRLRGEKIACIYGAEAKGTTATQGTAALQDSCAILTVENPSLRTVRISVTLQAVEPQPRREQPPVLLAAAAAAAAATASYLALSEGGRGKLCSALSIPVAYYITKRSDVARSPKRVKILEYLKANPGASMRRIARETGISYGEVQWHLSVLERLGLVECVKVGKYVCCFPAGTPAEVWLTRFAENELKLAPLTLARLREAIRSGIINPKTAIQQLLEQT